MAGVQAGDVDAGQTSGTSGGDQHQTIQVNDLMRDLSGDTKKKLKSLDDALIENTAVDEVCTTKPTIPRLPPKLRYLEVFKPNMVSIGPYHHHESVKVNEGMKIKLAAMFIKEHEVNKEHLYCTIRKRIKDLRNFYEVDETQKYSDDDLAWMFLIDGCVVLHFIYVMKYGYNVRTRKYEGLEIILAVTEIYKFQRDIMLLENQLPYLLLQLIISSRKESDRKKLEESIRGFILSLTWGGQPEEKWVTKENQDSALHLLDLFWRTVACVPTKKSIVVECIEWPFKMMGKPVHILMNFIINKNPRLRRTFNVPINLRSIQDLKEAGVEFRLNAMGNLTDVKFSHGTLLLPPIVLTHFYELMYKFWNLMAYEISGPSKSHNYDVCSYILFLASLIERPEDVKELRVRGILHNQIDGDEKVIELFKGLRIDNMVDFEYKYGGILEQIRKDHTKRRHRVWMAQFKATYFESPWSIIALIAAIMVLVMTFLQTYYTVLGHHKG